MGKGGGEEWVWMDISSEDSWLTKHSPPVFFCVWVFLWEMRLMREETSPRIYVGWVF